MKQALLRLFIVSSFLGLGVSLGPVYLSHLVLVGIVAAGLVTLVRDRGRLVLPRTASNLHLFLALLLAWYLVTCLWSPNKDASLRYLCYLAFGCAISWVVVYHAESPSRLTTTINILLAVMGLEIVLALFEALTTLRYPISPQSPLVGYFGREMLLEPWSMDQTTLATVTSYPTGFRWNPNNLATVLNLFLPFVLFRGERWLKAIAALAILVVIVMTSSKMNLAAWMLIVAIYLTFFSKRRGLYAITLALSMAAAVFALPLVSHSLEGRIPRTLDEALHGWEAVARFFSDEEYVGDSVTLRRQYLINGLEAIAETNGLGVGAGCSGEEMYQKGAISPGASRASLHNYWLEMAVDGGLLLVALFWLWYGYILVRLLQFRKKVSDPSIRYLNSASALSMIGMTVAAMAASSVVYESAMWLIYGVALASINLSLKCDPCAGAAT